MTLVHFLTASGVFAWMFIVWQAYHLVRGLPNRIRWALWPFKRARAIRRYG